MLLCLTHLILKTLTAYGVDTGSSSGIGEAERRGETPDSVTHHPVRCRFAVTDVIDKISDAENGKRKPWKWGKETISVAGVYWDASWNAPRYRACWTTGVCVVRRVY